MLTVKQVLECVCVRFTFPSSWNTLSVFLRVSFQGARYQYNCLPFGHFLAPSPSVSRQLWRWRVLFYLDDLLLMARSQDEAVVQTARLVAHRYHLGFMVNWKKSTPLPCQRLTYLGVVLDSFQWRAHLCLSLRRGWTLWRSCSAVLFHWRWWRLCRSRGFSASCQWLTWWSPPRRAFNITHTTNSNSKTIEHIYVYHPLIIFQKFLPFSFKLLMILLFLAQ